MKRLALVFVLAAAAAPALAQNPAVTIGVDANVNQHPIDPRIYGVNNGDGTALSDLNCPLTRLGGTFSSRYNWNVNAYNRGNDYFFESIVEDGGDMTAGRHADDFVSSAKANGSEPIMTVPMVGWVAKVGPAGENLCSFSVANYGAQIASNGDGCGNGCTAGSDYFPFCDVGTPIPGNDLNDADVPADETFQQAWVQHLIATHGAAAAGGLRYYGYDNEPSIWYLSHRDVHSDGAGMDEVLAKILAYGHMIRTNEPDAILLGPEEYNWDGYFSSGIDGKYYWTNCADGRPGPCNDPYPDRAAHAGADYIPWLLDQLYQHEQNTGERLLDVLAVHFYPQGDQAGRQEFSNDVASATQLLRNKSTRSLWDPSYVDVSYIGQEGIDGGVVKLIPRLKNWVNTYYPGIQVGLTEYSWGAENAMNGATAQADILGIFGREGLDLANRWEIPAPASPTYKAFKMYRNYDGSKATFGETSVLATAPDADKVSAFAALRASDGALTIMVVSKYLSGTTSTTIDVANFSSTMPAQVFRLAGNTITRQPDVAMSSGALKLTLPAQSVTLLVVPQGQGPMVMVGDAQAPELLAGTSTAVFTVTLSSPSADTVTVDYATADGTAQAGLDYDATTGVVQFNPGETSQTVGVTILGDALKEPNETFSLSLSGAIGATIDRATGTGTILDNSVVPKLQFSLASYVVVEGNVKATIAVKRTGLLTAPVGVSFATYAGTATVDADYTSAAGTLTFAAGVAVRTFQVPILADTLSEGDETVLLRLSSPTGGALLGLQSTALLTIRDNDPAGLIAFSPSSVRVAEATGQVVLSVRRTGGTNGSVTVDLATADGSAQDGADYSGATTTLTFGPGQTLQQVTIPIANDGAPEGEEYFTATLSNPTGGAKLGAAPHATVTINSTDVAAQFLSPTFFVSEAAAQAVISVKRTGSLVQPLTVNYHTSDGTAVGGTDYVGVTNTLSFPAGAATRTFPVKLLHNTVFAPPRTLNLTLDTPSVGVLGTSLATLTIKDDDVPGTVQFLLSDYTVSEGAGTASVKILRSGKLAAGQAVTLTTTDGTAQSGVNYSDATQTLSFALGEASKTVAIPILDDGTLGPGALSVHLALTSPDGGALVGAKGAATLWIVENQ
jgi:hypothetical protein